MNYLRPDIKRGNIGRDEEDLIIRLHSLLGNRWSLIAGRLPGRTDNEIKNYWNSHLSKKLKSQGIVVREGTYKGTSKRARKSQKRSDSVNNSNNHDRKSQQDKRKKESEGEDTAEITRTKIYIPKPTRFTPALRNCNLIENSTGVSEVPKTESTAASQLEDKGDISMEVQTKDLEANWYDINEGGFFFEEDDLNHVLAFDFPSKDRLLEGVYQEYHELLNSEGNQAQLNSFPDQSLFLW